MARRLVAILLIALVVAAASLLAPSAAMAQGCDTAFAEPDASFIYSDRSVVVEVIFDLDANNLHSVEMTRDRLDTESERLSPEAARAANAYLDDLAAWFSRPVCDAPVADDTPAAIEGAGVIDNVPSMPDNPFGFGAGDVVAAPPVVVQITSPQGVTTDIAHTVEPISDGPALAHSGSESIVLVYFGAGMVAFGAAALGMRRWMGGPID